ncbi:hypothetical protein [Undibacterium terreum]|uniref:Uncharacterized protein n=1 Tax=Undibacterium terreum TaxID=1224302 RepID=A0A916V291_9BURK|nr:hypothetical protein [Undibacterium terreum]GGD00210.1 hypothetical protein GCM10011396_54660 [Undibacterium terreum]
MIKVILFCVCAIFTSAALADDCKISASTGKKYCLPKAGEGISRVQGVGGTTIKADKKAAEKDIEKDSKKDNKKDIEIVPSRKELGNELKEKQSFIDSKKALAPSRESIRDTR